MPKRLSQEVFGCLGVDFQLIIEVVNCYNWSIPASTLNFYHIHEWVVRPATRTTCLMFVLNVSNVLEIIT